MFDAIPSKSVNIPTSAQMVAGYCDGPYAWTAADWARFPSAVKVRIATRASTDDGQVLDVENGDATPAQAPGWCAMRRAAGQPPSLYCNASTWPAVKAAFSAQEPGPAAYWIAAYDGVAVIPSGAVAKQFTDNAPANPYDTSVVADFWPGVDQEDEMLLVAFSGSGWMLIPGGVVIPDAASIGALAAAGVKQVVISQATFKALEAAAAPGGTPPSYTVTPVAAS
jgi:hypothetical protein